MTNWNFADIFEAVAAKVPERPCQVQGERVVTWGSFDRRANALAADLLEAGLSHQSKVAAYLYNGPEYLEVYVAAFKAGLAPVNTNYRYGPDEIVYLFDNADAEAVVFHATFTDLLEKVRDQLPKVRRWYVVADDAGDGPEWAVPYEAVVAGGADRVVAPWGRSGDDLLLLYTGGTTGMPKGVMWRQDDLFNVLGAGGNPILGIPPAADVAEVISRIDPAVAGMVLLSACPLMHGTGQFTALNAMAVGGAVVTLPSRHFRAAELWGEVARLKVNTVVIVGQAFAGPMLDELDAHPDTYDLSSVFLVVSSGVMWSQANKDGLLRHLPGAALFDSFGSSEAVGLGGSVSVKGAASETAKFQLGERVAVFTDDGRRVEPGSSEQGMVAVSGFIPVGYYKDEAKTASTFRTFEDRRWSVPGDWAEVNADGTLQAARARLGLHQHRGREGVPRGGRGGAEDAPGRARRRGRRAPRRALRRGDHRRRRAGGGVRCRHPRHAGGVREGAAGGLQGAAPRRRRRHDRSGSQRQGRLQAAEGPRRRACRRSLTFAWRRLDALRRVPARALGALRKSPIALGRAVVRRS